MAAVAATQVWGMGAAGVTRPTGAPSPTPIIPGIGGGYAQPGQPYYQPQVYYGGPNGYAYDPNQVPPATGGNPSQQQGHWGDRRQHHRQGQNGGDTGQTDANNNLNTTGSGNQTATQPGSNQTGSNQNTYGQRHNGGQNRRRTIRTDVQKFSPWGRHGLCRNWARGGNRAR